jgi:hypothetical protein
LNLGASTRGNESRVALLPGKLSGRRDVAICVHLAGGSMRHENFCSAEKNFPKEKVKAENKKETLIYEKRRYHRHGRSAFPRASLGCTPYSLSEGHMARTDRRSNQETRPSRMKNLSRVLSLQPCS